MPLQDKNKAALANKAAVLGKATEFPTSEKTYKFNEPVYETYTLPGEKLPNKHKRVKFQQGQVYTETQINRATS